MRTNIIILISLFIIICNNAVFSQIVATFIIEQDCTNSCSGSIIIDIDPTILDSGWELPFDIEYENITTGDYELIETNTYSIAFNDLCSGEYEIILFLNESCEYSANITIEAAEPINAELNSLIGCICSTGELVQAFELSVSDQSTPYSYQWSGPNNFTSAQQSPLINESGDYSVTISNAIGCERIESINIPLCSSFNVEVVTIPSCNNQATGEATAYASGEYPPFTFEWSNGETAAHTIDLAEGAHSLTITDGKGCQIVRRFEISTSPAISILSPSAVFDCAGEGQASITPGVISGTAPFSYLWSNGQTAATATNLTSGNHFLTITDNQGCSEPFDFVLDIGQPPIITYVIANAHCKNNDGGIKLDIQSPGNYSIEWSDGLMPNQSFRDDLRAGDYWALVRDADGCATTQYFAIDAIETSAELWEGVGIGLVTEAATQDYCNGSIEVVLDGTLGPYSVRLTAADGEVVQTYQDVSNSVLFENLCATEEGAFYRIKIVDVNGCPLEKSVAIELCSLTITLEEFSRPNTTESDDGSITVSIAENYDEVEYTWSNGVIGTTISGLSSGTYTVTAREKNGCTGMRTFEFDECHTLKEVLDEDGEVLLEVEVPNYETFELKVINGFFLEGETETEITILVKEEGATSFVVADPDIYHFDWYAGWPDDNPVVAQRPNYFPTFPTVIVSKDNCYSNEIMAALLGCGENLYEYDNLELSTFFIKDVVRPCGGLEDGSFLVQIPSEGVTFAEIVVNGEAQNYSPVESLSTISDYNGNLAPGNFNINITINEDCQFSFLYTLGSQPVDRIFTGLDLDEEICNYEIACGDVELGTLSEGAERLYYYGSDLPCKLPLRCGNYTEDKILPRLRMRGVEALHYLNTLEASGIVYSNLDFTRAYTNLKEGDNWECRDVQICPANLNVSYHGWHGAWQGSHIVSEDGCNLVICEGLFNDTSYDFCPSEIGQTIAAQFPTLITPDNPILSCTVVSENFGFLRDRIIASLDNPEGNEWEGSELLEFALEHQYRDEAYCTKIFYCKEDYSIVTDNFDSASCFDLGNVGINDVDGNQITTSCTPFVAEYNGQEVPAVICTNDFGGIDEIGVHGFYVWHIVDIISGLSGGFVSGVTYTEHENTQVITKGKENETLNSLARVKFNEITVPKGLIHSSTGNDYYDFIHDPTYVNKFPTNNEILFLIDDWDTGQAVDVSKVSATECLLTYQDSTIFWSQIIDGSSINIHKLLFNNNKITLIVSAESDLIVDGQLLSNAGEASYNIIIIDAQSGEIINTKVFYGLIPDETRIVDKDEDIDLFVKISEDGIRLNGQELYQTAQNEWVKLSLSPIVNDFDEKIRMSSEDAFDIIAYAVSPNQNQEVFIVNKPGGSNIGSTPISIVNRHLGNVEVGTISHSSTDFAQIYVTQSDGTPIRQIALGKTTESEIFKPLIDYDENGYLYFVTTFSGEISLGNQQFTSNGDKDILVVKLSPSGQFLWQQQYGSEDKEEVSQILAANNGLYLGGVFSGNTQSRQLGDYQMVNQTGDTTDKVFITFINGGAPQNLTQGDFDNEMNNILTGEKNVSNGLKAYPNPFKNTFSLELNTPYDDDITIEVVDLLGRLVFQQEEKVIKGFNQFEVKMKDISSSQMLNVIVRFKSGEKRSMQTRLIRE